MSKKIKHTPSYSGPLAQVIEEYILVKRNAGNEYFTEAKHFVRLDGFSKKFSCPINTLTKELVLGWTEKRPHEKHLTQIKRINAVKQFAIFMRSHGYEAYIYPYQVPNLTEPYIPYIFTEQEMGLLLKRADEYPPIPSRPGLEQVVPLVFRILYGCGLRACEMLNLKIKDIDLTNRILQIEKSKFGKSRIVPMAPSLALRCEKYLTTHCHLCTGDDYFIRNAAGQRYNANSIYYWFRSLLVRAGIPHHGKGMGPRLHDIRHTYAVHCLKKWVLAGNDVQALLPVLSAYMGHCDLRGTQIYLRLTPDLHPVIAETMNAFFDKSGKGDGLQ